MGIELMPKYSGYNLIALINIILGLLSMHYVLAGLLMIIALNMAVLFNIIDMRRIKK